MVTKLNPDMFREYDIRGIAGTDLNDCAVRILGRAVGTYLRRNGCEYVVLGRDCRISSTRIRDVLYDVFLQTGLQVTDLGVCHTPLMYFSLHQLNVDGGVMITGSHNPAEYNGLKIALGKLTIHGDQIREIRSIAESKNFWEGRGRGDKVSLLPVYRQYLVDSIGSLANPPRVAVDCGNGTASLIAPQLYRDLGCEVVELYCTMDGNFPNHHPDPTVVENLQELILKVQENSLDLGIAFDGDGDRIGVVDDQGDIIWGDYLMILYSRDILQGMPSGKTIIGEVKCSKNLYDDIKKHGGKGVMWRAGHSLIKAKMKDEQAVFAGEMSGHMMFADRYFGYDDAIYAGARLLSILSERERKISELLSDVPKTYSSPEIRMECPDRLKFKVVRRVQEFFAEKYKIIDIDGVRVVFDDGWGLLRASNTQPGLVIRFEAQSAERLKEIRDLFEGKLREFVC